MRQMLRNEGRQKGSGSVHQSEINAIQASRKIEAARKRSNWTPGIPSMTAQDIRDNLDKLRMDDANSQVAVSKAD